MARFKRSLFFVALAGCGGQEGGGVAVVSDRPRVVEMAVWNESQWRSVENVSLPSSPHPYANKSRRQWTLTAPTCAQAVRIKFAKIDMESGYDFIRIKDASNKIVQQITGKYDSFTTEPISGNKVRIQLFTDRSVRKYGFDVAGFEAIETLPMCPMRPTVMCAPGTVDVTTPPAMCQCPSPPTCESLATFSASLITSGGYSGAGGGQRLFANSHEVYNVTLAPLAIGGTETTELVAYADLPAITDLARTLVYQGFFSQAGSAGTAGNMTTSFTASFRGATRTLYWPVGDPSGAAAQWLDAINLFKKAVACSNDPTAIAPALCIDTHACNDDGSCQRVTCDGVTCEPGYVCDVQPVTCIRAPCPPQPLCIPDPNENGCARVRCAQGTHCVDLPNGGASCEPDAGFCGGVAGAECPDNGRCRYATGVFAPPYPGAGGSCVPAYYCDAVSDCDVYPHIMCVGSWSCAPNTCAYTCGGPPQNWVSETVNFGTANPYANNASSAWKITGDAGTTAIRVNFTTFDLESGYDFVVLYDAGWNEVARYSGSRGAFASDSVQGNVAYVVMTSDSSMTGAGFRASSVEYLLP